MENEEVGEQEEEEGDEMRLIKGVNGEYQMVANDYLGKDMEPIEEERIKIRTKG